MLTVGANITVTIEDVALGGKGVARHERLAIFIPYTAIGDEVVVRITKLKPSYALAEPLSLLAASPHRTPPLCPHFGICGGCAYQHLAYPHQVAIKEKQLSEVMRRIGKMEHLPLLPSLPSPAPYYYRRKADFHLVSGQGGAILGFMKAKSNEVSKVESCPLLAHEINIKLPLLGKQLATPCRDYRTTKKITVWAEDDKENDKGKDWGTKADNIGYPKNTRHERQGEKRLLIRVKDRDFLVPRTGFFQANIPLTPLLVDTVIKMCGSIDGALLVDAYCGSGLFSAFLGESAGIIAIERDRRALACAAANLASYGYRQARFYNGDCGVVLKEQILGRGKKPDIVIVDPPRQGCPGFLLDNLCLLDSLRLIYISCNPAMLARDVRRLGAGGFRLKALQMLDMFPQCANIEAVALLEKP